MRTTLEDEIRINALWSSQKVPKNKKHKKRSHDKTTYILNLVIRRLCEGLSSGWTFGGRERPIWSRSLARENFKRARRKGTNILCKRTSNSLQPAIALKNTEIQAIIQAMGLKPHTTYKDTKSLRYGRIMLMMDQVWTILLSLFLNALI